MLTYLEEFKLNQFVYREGDKANEFYIVKEGEF